MRNIVSTSFLLFIVTVNGYSEEFRPQWQPNQVRNVDTFSSGQKIVGTHYFYWYDYPEHHFFDNGEKTDDALQDHFVDAESVSFRSVEWHKQELEDIAAAGIDFIIPVYWGVPDNYFRPGISFSIEGLPPLQRAIDEREREGKISPKIGLFYDTSTLLPGIRGVAGNDDKYDLTEKLGKSIFYRTIRDYFYQIEPKHWACIDGKPIVVLYGSGFVKRHDQSTVDYVYEQFAKDFHGVKPYIIKDNSWNFDCDATTQWGAALNGPNIFDHVAQIGPGYNDSAVPGRSTPIREREDGNFYKLGWNIILNNVEINIVLIETWNEMHEGTDICASKEFGKDYIELTAKYAKVFKANQNLNEDIQLEYPKLRPRPANNNGMEFKDAQSVSISFGENGSKGISLVRGVPDGPVNSATVDGKECIQSIQADNTYIYFDVADPFYFDQKETLEISIQYLDDGFNSASLQYDSHDESATLEGAYDTALSFSSRRSKQWVMNTFRLDDARFVNRQNNGSDFRLSVNGQLAIAEISIKKIKP